MSLHPRGKSPRNLLAMGWTGPRNGLYPSRIHILKPQPPYAKRQYYIGWANTSKTTTTTKILKKQQQIKNIATSRKSLACYPQAKLRFILVHYLVCVSCEFGFDNIKIMLPVVCSDDPLASIGAQMPLFHAPFFRICVIYLWTIFIEQCRRQRKPLLIWRPELS
jgi:hypothetical protein